MAKEKKTKAKETEETKETEEAVKEEQTEKETDEASKELQKALDEAKEKNDQLLRMAAEYDNFRKRTQKEKESLYSECKSSVVKDLLPVIDNFERCVDYNEGTSFEDYRKGVEMTYKQFSDFLKKLGVEEFGKAGDEFDPNFHNAVMHTEDENLPENTISQVLMKGYKLGDKIIRPAMVAVAN